MAKAAKPRKTDIPGLDHETPLWQKGGVFVFGVDEAGRGCLAGPVCAAVSAWAPFSVKFGLPVPVRDSKLMTEAEREAAFAPVGAYSLACGVGFGTAAEIDEWNILRANHLAVARALENACRTLVSRGVLSAEEITTERFAFISDGSHALVGHARFFVLSDRYREEFPLLQRLFRRPLNESCVVKGDSKVFSIASASVLAKVSRDRLMMELDQRYPEYEFARHKGYSTERHIAHLRRVGPCAEHRRSFSPVEETAKLF